MKKKIEIFEEMRLLEHDISNPQYEIIHPYYQSGYMECLNKMFDVLELGDDVKDIDPEYIFGDGKIKLMPRCE